MTDYISNLPELVLVIILELLATQEAVGTCILSKLCNNLWTSFAILNINAWDSQAQYSMVGINALLEKITYVHTLEFHLNNTLHLLCQIINGCPNLTKLPIVQDENCYCEATLPLEDRVVHLLETITGRVQASPRTNMEMVEVRYWRFDLMVWRVMQYLMLGTRELENFRNYRVMNGYYDHPYKAYNGGNDGYSAWDWGVVQFECAGLDTIQVKKSLLIY